MKVGSQIPSTPVQQFDCGEVKQVDLAKFSQDKTIAFQDLTPFANSTVAITAALKLSCVKMGRRIDTTRAPQPLE